MFTYLDKKLGYCKIIYRLTTVSEKVHDPDILLLSCQELESRNIKHLVWILSVRVILFIILILIHDTFVSFPGIGLDTSVHYKVLFFYVPKNKIFYLFVFNSVFPCTPCPSTIPVQPSMTTVFTHTTSLLYVYCRLLQTSRL